MVAEQKTSLLERITTSLVKSNNFVVVHFEKTPHQALETLRKELKKSGSEIKIVKNSLFEKTINKLSVTNKVFAEIRKKFFPLTHNSAILTFTGDWSRGLNAFYQFIQKEKTLDFKFAFLDGVSYDETKTGEIAKLPGKDQLIAKILGGMKNPSIKLVYALKFNTNKLVYILKAKGVSKDG